MTIPKRWCRRSNRWWLKVKAKQAPGAWMCLKSHFLFRPGTNHPSSDSILWLDYTIPHVSLWVLRLSRNWARDPLPWHLPLRWFSLSSSVPNIILFHPIQLALCVIIKYGIVRFTSGSVQTAVGQHWCFCGGDLTNFDLLTWSSLVSDIASYRNKAKGNLLCNGIKTLWDALHISTGGTRTGCFPSNTTTSSTSSTKDSMKETAKGPGTMIQGVEQILDGFGCRTSCLTELKR